MLCVPSALTRWSHINRRRSASASHFSSAAPSASSSHHKAQKKPEMSPSITTEASLPLPNRSTVAQRKQANELRKTLKPLLEKRRRARINDSLSHLKSLILPLVGKDNARYSKLEKADILEMTVRFLRDLPASPVKDSADSYREGYKACLQRVSTLLPKTSLDQDACQRVSDFVQQSMSATVTPTCLNCCAQSSRTFPQIQQRLLSLKSSFSPRMENQSRSSTSNNSNSNSSSSSSSSGAVAPSRAQPGPQPVNAAMWRPW
ncbi:Transcription factor HES-2 [Solea senegalensis]|uniref:Transcription factor HES-2 n=2 Tax=Solea senegalensis TaxID=28829 RepID=A0AAV6SQT7_SOLSE|nr:Transcription factor HES-2 [Solea senegalensis]